MLDEDARSLTRGRALIAGCATLPPATPIHDVKELAGTWQGTVDPVGAPPFTATMTVNPDGSYRAMTPRGPVTGKFVQVTDGKAVYQ